MEGAKSTKSEPVPGTGDEATAVRYDLKKKEGTFKQQTIVARVENVVVTLDYNGAGLAGDKSPSGDDLAKDAKKAAKEAVGAVSDGERRGRRQGEQLPVEAVIEVPLQGALEGSFEGLLRSASKTPAKKS